MTGTRKNLGSPGDAKNRGKPRNDRKNVLKNREKNLLKPLGGGGCLLGRVIKKKSDPPAGKIWMSWEAAKNRETTGERPGIALKIGKGVGGCLLG